MRILLAVLVLGAAAAPARAAAPTMPSSKGAAVKQCRSVVVNTYRFQVWVTHGQVACKTARRVAKQGVEPKGWTYYDWTDRNGPWSDAYVRNGTKRTIGLIAPKA